MILLDDVFPQRARGGVQRNILIISSLQLRKPLPVTLALFGGYRKDDYNIVIDLHLSSIARCRSLLCAPKFIEECPL